MSAIANHSRNKTRLSILAGGVLLAAWAFSATPSTPKDALQQKGLSGQQTENKAARPRFRARWFQFGRASWYGATFQGQPTASGETFDMYQMTCAHRSLPLGALVRVTNLRNHRSVVVRVNDRGPQVENRIVDLSYGAARVLGFHGMTRVRLELIDPSPTSQEVSRLSWPQPHGN